MGGWGEGGPSSRYGTPQAKLFSREHQLKLTLTPISWFDNSCANAHIERGLRDIMCRFRDQRPEATHA